MSKQCPIYGKAISQDCVECETRDCRRGKKYKTICLGIDQSYKNCGISVTADGRLLKVSHIDLLKYNSNSERRKILREKLAEIVYKIKYKSENIVCIVERIRLTSQGFLNIDYIKSIGALNSVIVDVMTTYGLKVYSVDTRCWKAQVVGTSKPQNNKYGVPPEKWPTVKWVCEKGFEKSILREVKGRREKGTFTDELGKWEYDNDAADSAAISMFWFVGDRSKLKEEK